MSTSSKDSRRQSPSTRSRPRATRGSTVGTVTEVYDYLRLLYARIGRPHCPNCGRPVARQSPQQIVDRILAMEEGTRFMVLAPVVRGRKGEYAALLDDLAKQGFARARVDGVTVELADRGDLDMARYEQHTIEVVVDRLVRRDDIRRRLTESLETALSLAEGVAEIVVVDGDGQRGRGDHLQPAPGLHPLRAELRGSRPRATSPSTPPTGPARPAPASGPGSRWTPSWWCPIRPSPWPKGRSPHGPGARSQYFDRMRRRRGRPRRLLGGHAVGGAPQGRQEARPLRRRATSRSTSSTATATGASARSTSIYEGIVPWLQRRHTEAESDFLRDNLEGYLREVPCPECEGARLKPESLAVTVGGYNIFALCSLPIGRAVEVVATLDLSDRDHLIADRVFREVRERMQFLLDVGLDYLTLARSAATLSGGEAQRIRLASQIGSGLVGVLYVLDEPSIGLHQRDNQRLIGTSNGCATWATRSSWSSTTRRPSGRRPRGRRRPRRRGARWPHRPLGSGRRPRRDPAPTRTR